MVTLLACACTPGMAGAQEASAGTDGQGRRFTGGPFLEAGFSNFLHSGTGDGVSRMKAGFTAGGFVQVGLGRLFSLQGELLFHYRNSGFRWDGQTADFSYWGVEVPIYALCHYDLPKGGRLFAGLGPYVDFGLEATLSRDGHKSDLYERGEGAEAPPLRDSHTGFAVKLGYEFACGFQLVATYKASVTNLLDANSSSASMHPQAVSFGVAWRFGK